MIFIFYILAAVLIYFSYKSFRGGISYLNYFKKELAKPRSLYTPFATIIAPCKGLDEGLRENLAALLEQDYPDYEVIFVVDARDDPAISIIENLLNLRDAETRSKEIRPQINTDEHRWNLNTKTIDPGASASLRLGGEKVRLVVAPKAVDTSQKIENLREAVLHVNDESKVFVFVDSDARPAIGWLRHLAAPLEDENIGAATGYRWFISKNLTFASEMQSIWNASIASALGANTGSNFCWGGSMAIRRDTFERLNIREKWLGTLSDDFVVTRTMKAVNLPIYFVPQALTATIEDFGFSELLEFTTRQMKITRVYASKLWLMSLFGSGLFNFVMIWSVFIVIFTTAGGIEFWAALITLFVVGLCSIAKSTLRLNAVRLVLEGHRVELKRQYWTHNVLTFLTPALFLYNCVAAAFSRTLTWRGITYKLTAADKTEMVTVVKR